MSNKISVKTKEKKSSIERLFTFLNWIEFNLLTVRSLKWLLPFIVILIILVRLYSYSEIVKHGKVESSLFITIQLIIKKILVLMWGISIVLILNRAKRRYVPSGYNILICSLVLLSVLFIRWSDLFHSEIILRSTLSLSKKWVDIVLPIVSVPIMLKIWHGLQMLLRGTKRADRGNKLPEQEVQNNSEVLNVEELRIDNHDTEVELLGRKDELKIIMPKIRQVREDALTIGINGDWGSGKSYFIKLVVNELQNDKDNIIINFNPWKSYSEANGMELELGKILSEEVGKYNGNLRRNMMDYFTAMLKTDFSSIETSISSIGNFINQSSLQVKYNKINKAIQGLQRQIYVIIDDLDRLSNEEVVALIRLIRNTINFKRIKFILAYDRSYLQNALKEQRIFNYTEYLSKIINFEYTLKYYSEDEYRKIFLDLLSKYCPDITKNENYVLLKVLLFRSVKITDMIKNIRQMKQFVADFVGSLKRLPQVNIVDLYCYELIKYKYPDVLRHFYFRYNDFIALLNNGHYILHDGEGNALMEYLRKREVEKSISEGQATKLFNLFFTIFGPNNLSATDTQNIINIKQGRYFELYFRGIEGNGETPESEWLELVKLDYEYIKEVIVGWIREKDSNSIRRALYNERFLKPNGVDDAVKKIKIIFLCEEQLYFKQNEADDKNAGVNVFNHLTLYQEEYNKVLDNEFNIQIENVINQLRYPFFALIRFLSECINKPQTLLDKRAGLDLMDKVLNKYPGNFNSNVNVFADGIFFKMVDLLPFNVIDTDDPTIEAGINTFPIIKNSLLKILTDNERVLASFVVSCFILDKTKKTCSLREIYWQLFPGKSLLWSENFEDYLMRKEELKEMKDLLVNYLNELEQGTLKESSLRHIKPIFYMSN